MESLDPDPFVSFFFFFFGDLGSQEMGMQQGLNLTTNVGPFSVSGLRAPG